MRDQNKLETRLAYILRKEIWKKKRKKRKEHMKHRSKLKLIKYVPNVYWSIQT